MNFRRDRADPAHGGSCSVQRLTRWRPGNAAARKRALRPLPGHGSRAGAAGGGTGAPLTSAGRSPGPPVATAPAPGPRVMRDLQGCCVDAPFISSVCRLLRHHLLPSSAGLDPVTHLFLSSSGQSTAAAEFSATSPRTDAETNPPAAERHQVDGNEDEASHPAEVPATNV